MSIRLKLVLIGLGSVAVIALWFLFVFRPNRAELADLNQQIETTKVEIRALEAELQRLQALQRNEPQLRADLARLTDALPPDHRVPSFILQLQEAANLAGVDFLSIGPSQPAPAAAGGHQVISVSLSTTGTFFQVEDFIFRLGRLDRAVTIDSFSLSPAAPLLSVGMSLRMFSLPEAAPPAPAPAPAPGASPAPAASPTPTPAAA